MNDDQVPGPNADQRVETIDLRGELRSNLTDEFKTALLSCTALTENQRTALSKAVDEGTVTTTAILQTLSATED